MGRPGAPMPPGMLRSSPPDNGPDSRWPKSDKDTGYVSRYSRYFHPDHLINISVPIYHRYTLVDRYRRNASVKIRKKPSHHKTDQVHVCLLDIFDKLSNNKTYDI